MGVLHVAVLSVSSGLGVTFGAPMLGRRLSGATWIVAAAGVPARLAATGVTVHVQVPAPRLLAGIVSPGRVVWLVAPV